eukprot:2128280-Pleurochrysis_carterae.AAC.4
MMFETCEVRGLQANGQTVTLQSGDVVRCADSGYYFVALNMFKPQLGYAVTEDKSAEMVQQEARQATLDKCRSARHLGGHRV